MSAEAERPVLERVDADAESAAAPEAGHQEGARRRRPTGEPPPLPAAQRWRGYRWGIVAFIAAVASLFALAYSDSDVVARADEALNRGAVALRTDLSVALAEVLSGLTNEWTLRILRWGTIAVLLAVRRIRHLLVFVGAILVVEWATALLNYAITRPRPMVPIVGAWEGFSHPSRPVAGLVVTLIGMRSVLVPPGPWRGRVASIIGVLTAVVGIARVLLGVDHPTDVLVAAALGAGVGFLALRLLAPSNIVPVVYRRGETAHVDLTPERLAAIRDAARDQLGLAVADIELHATEGSAGSTPLRVQLADPSTERDTVFAKLYTHHHVRSDRSYKLGRLLLYGALEDEAPFASVRHLVLYEDHMTRVMRDAGLPVPAPLGIIEITPAREYAILFEYLADGDELDAVEVDEELIDQAWSWSRTCGAQGSLTATSSRATCWSSTGTSDWSTPPSHRCALPRGGRRSISGR
ncbi:MAG: hypothetical protein KY469_06830 [Actinobacteria bacterium]|nr:hypothetical protein [Actinomycetota bacterium]